MRDILTALAALVAIALAALMVGPHFVDWNDQRARISAAFEAETGIETRITGTLRIGLLPTPELDVEGIEFGPAGAPTARVGRLTATLSPMALLRGRIAILSARADRAVVSLGAIRQSLETTTGEPPVGSNRLAQIGIERLDLKSTRFVEAIAPHVSSPGGASSSGGGSALDLVIEAPSLAGPFRVEIHDPAQGRDLTAQIGQLEKGRARLKASVEDRHLAARVALDGWFALPGVTGRPIFDGAATFSGNPVVTGAGGVQMPFQGTARLIAHLDQGTVDPVNLTLGSGENALQLAGQGFFDFTSARPVAHLKFAAKRFDAQPHLAEGAAQGNETKTEKGKAEVGMAGKGMARGALLSGMGSLLRDMTWLKDMPWLKDLPLDGTLDLTLDAIQVPGALIRDVAFSASLRSGKGVVEAVSAELPGATHARFRRDERAGDAPIDGRLDVDSGEFQTLVGWIRGAENAVNLPTRARLTARLAGRNAGLAIRDMQIESPAGTLDGSGELLPVEPGKRIVPRLALDLVGERFDARVLAALDPLRPIPGLELTTKLAVHRLVLDGQALGGLEVALDRDGSTATLRRLRLTGRKGEEVALSGTASGEAIQLTAKIDAERLGDIARLAGALLPGAATEAILKRAELLEPAIAVASFRIVTKSGDATWDVAVDGKLGGTVFKGRGQSAFTGADLVVRVEGDLENPDGGRLAGQLFGVMAPVSPNPGRLALKAMGNPRRSVTGTLTGTLAGIDMRFEGGLNPFRARPVEGRFTLHSADLSLLGKALGGGAPSLMPGLGARASGRLFTERAKVTLTGLDAQIGDEPVAGEVSFDLARRGQIAGQLRMGEIVLPSLLAPAIGALRPADGKGWSRSPFAPALAPLVSGDLWIEAREARFGEGLTLSSPQFVLRFSPGTVTIEAFEAKAGEARVAGNLSLLRKAERVVVGGRVDFTRLPLAGLVAGLDGRLAGSIPFSAEGGSPFDLVSTLSGAGRITLDDLVVRAGDPQALPRIVAMPLDDLAPINENHIGGLLDQELRKGTLRIASAAWPLSLLNGQIRIGGTVQPAGVSREVGLAPTFLVDLVRREAEARFTYSQTQLPKGWRGAVPEISLVLAMRQGGGTGKTSGGKGVAAKEQAAKEPGQQRRLQVSSLVNGFLAMAIQRDLERAEAFEADVREREAQLRRQRGDAFMARREREIREVEAAVAVEAILLRHRAEAAAELERQRQLATRLEREAAEAAARAKARLAEEKLRQENALRAPVVPPASTPPTPTPPTLAAPNAPAASGAPLDLAPKIPPAAPPG